MDTLLRVTRYIFTHRSVIIRVKLGVFSVGGNGYIRKAFRLFYLYDPGEYTDAQRLRHLVCHLEKPEEINDRYSFDTGIVFTLVPADESAVIPHAFAGQKLVVVHCSGLQSVYIRKGGIHAYTDTAEVKKIFVFKHEIIRYGLICGDVLGTQHLVELKKDINYKKIYQ